MTDKHSITGRDGYIVAKALYWALKFSQSQPEGIREVSDEEDMKAILTARYPQFGAGFRLQGETILAILRDAEIHGDDLDADHDMRVAFATPPDLSPDFRFNTDGSDPTSEPEFTEEDEPGVVNHKRNRAALAQAAKDTVEAFRTPALTKNAATMKGVSRRARELNAKLFGSAACRIS